MRLSTSFRFARSAVPLILFLVINAAPADGADGSLGILARDVTQSDVERLGLTSRTGVLVDSVLPIPNATSPLKQQDVILQIADKEVIDHLGLQKAMRFREVDAEVDLRLIREQQQLTISITLCAIPNDIGARAAKLARDGKDDYKRMAADLLVQGFPSTLEPETAYRWLKESASEGHLTSIYNVALCLQSGFGTRQDTHAAENWFRKAAAMGDARSMHSLGLMYASGALGTPDEDAAFRWNVQAADLNYALGINYVGWAYENGKGVISNKRRAMQNYLRAAQLGLVTAQANVGRCLYSGIGTQKDAEAAAKFFRVAAMQGDSEGQAWLGLCHHNGEGVERDLDEAKKWYDLAAEQGSLMARHNLARMMLYGEGQEADHQAALTVFRENANSGDVESLVMIGTMYENGWALPRSGYSAIKLYLQAEKGGSQLAAERLKAIGVRSFEVSTR